jgi:hypothetical protein
VQTYPKVDEASGTTLGFEIEMEYISLAAMARVLSSVEGVTDLRRRRLFSRFDEIHIWFRYRSADCVVWEPFGDNSRYWIGQLESSPTVDMSDLEKAFQNYDPPLIRRIIGDIVSLRVFKSLFRIERR